MGNYFNRLTNPQLIDKAGNISSIIIETPAVYGVTTSQVEAMEEAREALETSSAFAEQANQAKLAAYETQNFDRQFLLQSLSDLTQRIYATPTVTDAELLKAGLSARPTRNNRPINTPINLVANEMTQNRVSLRWNRAGNNTPTIFLVETRTEAGPWVTAGQFSKTRATLQDFPAGETAYFRVVAVRNNVRSLPSNEAVIYGEGAGATLMVA